MTKRTEEQLKSEIRRLRRKLAKAIECNKRLINYLKEKRR